MARTIEQVSFQATVPKLLRVAAYARVSSGKDAMLHSLSAQVSYYSDLIQHHKGWQYVGTYSDEAKTGTEDRRESFQRLLQDCRDGKIDLVVTKSISRLARNTVTLLKTVRELKALGVDIFFEEQNLHTLSCDGELMLTILASYAEEESRSVSENQKWRVRKNFEGGIPWNSTVLGYRCENGKFVVVPEEAKVVTFIFREYLNGKGVTAIMKKLNEKGLRTRHGNQFCINGIACILRNYSYTGNLLLQTTYRENYLTKRMLVNNGELPKYHASNTHEKIIDMATFEAVQAEMRRRTEKHAHSGQKMNTYPFTGLIVCGNCGKPYRRKVTNTGPVWICSTFNTLGKAYCASKQIPASALEALTADMAIGDLTAIRAQNDNTLVFCFKDGTESVKRWADRSRAESWTPEMRSAARQKSIEKQKAERSSSI